MPFSRYTPEEVLKLLRLQAIHDGLVRTVSCENGRIRYLYAILMEHFRRLVRRRIQNPRCSSKMEPSGYSKPALANPVPCEESRL